MSTHKRTPTLNNNNEYKQRLTQQRTQKNEYKQLIQQQDKTQKTNEH